MPYPRSVERSKELLGGIAFATDHHLYFEGDFTKACIAAFLTVIAVMDRETQDTESSSQSALSQFDRDICMNIFQFASSRMPRVIAIEPEKPERQGVERRRMR